MAFDAHLQSLGRRHQALESALAAEMKNPHIDEQRLHDLKRRKLRLKDQMAELERTRDDDAAIDR